MTVDSFIIKCGEIAKHAVLDKVTTDLEISDTELCQFIFTQLQTLLNFLESISIFVKVFTRTTFADILGFLSGFETLAHIFGHIKKSKIVPGLYICKQRVVKNCFKLFFLSKLMFVYGRRLLDSLNRLWKNAKMVKRSTTINLFLVFQQTFPLVEKRCFRWNVFG